jgi:hypothetical protein
MFEHVFRILPTSGGQHVKDAEPTFMGDQVARWDGDGPKIFTAPWIVKRQFELMPTYKLGEYVCEPGR